MTPKPEPNPEMEQLIHRTLRDLPPRRAPSSIEQRVLTEIARRAARPWWRKSFAHWPIPALAVFVVVSAALVKLAFMAGVWVMAGVDTTSLKDVLAQPLSWVESGLVVVHAVTGFCDIMLRNIPPLWLYGGLVFFASMYATLFGLGAAAYKALVAQR
jgi:hypothetical protein